MTMTSTDRIQKSTMIRAPRSRVWRALTDAKEFGTWFGADFDGPFAVGARIQGKIKHKGYEHMPLEVTVEKMEPEKLFSFRWHPYPMDPSIDYSKEPTTLIEFTLEEVADGTVLTVTESGFDRIPLARRAKAFEMNDKGWAGQLKAIDEYLNRSK
jgi:uncharacterized protein YndB with AHSA1/START domain